MLSSPPSLHRARRHLSPCSRRRARPSSARSGRRLDSAPFPPRGSARGRRRIGRGGGKSERAARALTNTGGPAASSLASFFGDVVVFHAMAAVATQQHHMFWWGEAANDAGDLDLLLPLQVTRSRSPPTPEPAASRTRASPGASRMDQVWCDAVKGDGARTSPSSPPKRSSSSTHLPQAEEGEEDDEIERLFKGNKKKKKNDRPRADIGLIVEQFIAEFEVAAEEDANLNRQSKPAINKLVKLPLLLDVLSKKHLQQEFLDHGVLTLLKNWLEPLPDGSMPNMNIRSAVLKLLTDFPIDLEQHDRREQLKKSGLGKVIMFLSKSDEETTANRKLAKELVDKWSRPIFNKSTRFEDMRRYDDERAPYRRPQMKKPTSSSSGMESRDDDLDADFSQRKSGQSSSRQHASRPEASPLDFVIRPQSKIDPEQIRARAKQAVQDQRRLKMNKKLQQLKAPKKKNLQASKLSVEGRGMIKYL